MQIATDKMLIDNYQAMEIQGKTIWVPKPVQIPHLDYVEREDLVHKTLAAWMRIDGLPPLHFRLYGPPGCGKNSLVYHLARILGQNGTPRNLYIINGFHELSPEDIAVSATMTSSQTIAYVGSPLMAAVLFGGICFFDEIAKVSSDALSLLAGLLDDRRTLTSSLAGIHIKAHDDFLFCAALNEDEEEGMRLPRYIEERTRPSIYVGQPSPEVLEKILYSRLPLPSKKWVKAYLKEFRETLSPRGAVTLVSYAYKISRTENNAHPTSHEIYSFLKKAAETIRTDTQGV